MEGFLCACASFQFVKGVGLDSSTAGTIKRNCTNRLSHLELGCALVDYAFHGRSSFEVIKPERE